MWENSGDADNHAGYITYLLQHHQLPDFDPRGHWQFYHPPLHHMISALWLWLSEHVFGISNAAAQESLQTLSLFYARRSSSVPTAFCGTSGWKAWRCMYRWRW